MFDQLFGSKTRVKLLSLFLNNPGRAYYVREITRKIDEQINSVRRELSNLLSIGLIKSTTQNNRLYYEVNDKYVHFNEMRRIFGSIKVGQSKALKNTREEEDIVSKLRTSGTIELAFLTGSFVRDSHTKIDLFVVGDVNRSKVAKVVTELEQGLGRELNYTVMTSEDYGYRMDLNDRFLADLMDAKKIVLADAKRVLPETVKIPTQVEVELSEEEEGGIETKPKSAKKKSAKENAKDAKDGKDKQEPESATDDSDTLKISSDTGSEEPETDAESATDAKPSKLKVESSRR